VDVVAFDLVRRGSRTPKEAVGKSHLLLQI
jgi:hypothetical protein